MRSILETPSTSSATALPKVLAISLLVMARVLHHVVQQRRHERLRIEVPFGEDLRHRERVGDVRLAAVAVLPGVRRARHPVGLLDLLDVLGLEVAQDRRQLLGARSRQ